MKYTEKANGQYDKMTDAPIKKLLFSLSLPAVISMMVTNIYNFADTAFVGTLGTSESGATGVVFSFMTILQACAFMCGQGAGSIMSRKLGEKKTDEATVYASTGFFLSFGLGAVVCALTFIFMDPLLDLLGSTETIDPFAKTYITYIALAAPFFTSSLTMNNLLRYEGKAKLGTVGMMTGAVINIGLDALLVPYLKIAGAGIATAASQIISFLILIFMFFSGKTQTKISIKHFSRNIKQIFDIPATGFPSLLRQGLTGASGMILNQKAAFFGDEAVAAFSCVSRISFFAMAVAIGIGQGFQPISSYNYGAGRKGRVREAFRTALISEEIVVIILSIPIYLFSRELIWFLRPDEAVVNIGERALHLLCIAQLFVPLTMMIEMGFQSIGEKVWATVGSSLRSGILLIPSLIILFNYRGLEGIQEAQPVSFVLSFIIGIFLAKVYMDKLS